MTDGSAFLVACIKKDDKKILSKLNRFWLEDDEIEQFDDLMEYFRDTGELMGVNTFCKRFDLDADEADSRPGYYLRQIRNRYMYAMLSDNVPKILRGAKTDPAEKLEELQNLVSKLSSDSMDSKDTLYSEDTEKRKAEYEERMKCLGVTYLSIGSADADKIFYGYRKEDLWTIGGKAGQGKSWLLVYLTYLAERVIREREEAMGEKLGDALFITNEMPEEEIKERLDCIRFKLPYQQFMEGTLSSKNKERYYTGLDRLSKRKSKIRIAYSCQTIDELTTLIGLYKPSIVFIDGSYLMEGKMQEGWEKIVYITRNLKRIAKSMKVPIVNTTQLKRGSSKTASKFALDGQDDFAYSSSYTQDSDIAIKMFQDADMKFHDLVGMEVVKGRRVIAGTVMMFQNDLLRMSQSITKPESVEDDVDDEDDIPKSKGRVEY